MTMLGCPLLDGCELGVAGLCRIAVGSGVCGGLYENEGHLIVRFRSQRCGEQEGAEGWTP
jgi:hypothetical protein